MILTTPTVQKNYQKLKLENKGECMKTIKELLRYHPNNRIKTPYLGIVLFLSLVVSIQLLPYWLK